MVRLPSEYQEVGYLESTGTQWIDVGVKLTDQHSFSIDVSILGSGAQRVFGSYMGNAIFAVGQSSNENRLFFDIESYRYRVNTSIVGYNTGFHNFAVKNKEFFVDYVSYGLSNGSVATSNYNALLFTYNQSQVNPSFSRIKTCKVLNNNTLLRNFIPCYRKSDNKPGMYDLVTKQFFVNQGTGEFLVGPDVIRHDTPALVLRRRLLLNTPHVETASGSIATFSTDMVGKLKECKIYFEPVQAGSGDPSPDNVRPITGWTGCEVTRCGKNFWPFEPFSAPKSANGITISTNAEKQTYFVNGTSDRAVDVSLLSNPARLKWKLGSRYSLASRMLAGKVDLSIGGYARPVSIIDYRGISHMSVTASYRSLSGTTHGVAFDNVTYNIFRASVKDQIFENAEFNIQLELGNTVTEFEPYQGTTIPIDWTDEAGTVYGGYVDLTKGEVVAEWIILSFDGSENWYTLGSSVTTFYLAVEAIPPQPINDMARYCISNIAKNRARASIAEGEFGVQFFEHGSGWIGYKMASGLVSGLADFKTYLSNMATSGTPVQAVIKLYTRTIYTIDPITLKTLRGTNNIFANTNGDVEVKYWKH